ncbi:LacI family DNA-binding transcriptional regulator [Microbacterium sp. MPKO10]|uniref:LacI family DNA-binding transcriptional regulator n=1 Tax=Microbacterium sp. MPKO10 TaxID=2989818 RepID=UPI002236BAF5|nr:LacI family DNA-binding transcriptional regulator [Microbacterium sp. MPKO10]MCW4456767.1 LacI family transcriptional regulator [Microbacterium sp. MPKO10]
MRATMRDVATRAGVSPKTVSNVINGVVFVRPDTRERVEQAMAELDYVPNLSARGLRNGRSGVLALALPNLDTQYSAETIGAFVEAAHGRGWAIQVEETGAEPQRERELLSRARAHLVDGLILNPITLEDSVIAQVQNLPPLVLIGEVEQSLVDLVGVDSRESARDMTRHLIAGGNRRIATVGSPIGEFQTATARQRTEGYRDALREAGLAPDAALEIGCDAWTAAGAASAFASFLDETYEVPDAVFSFTDTMALGVLNVLWARGLRVPDDVRVAGFDNTVDSPYAVPPLTTVAFDRRDLASRAIGRLEQRLGNPRLEPERVRVPYDVVVRESTRA